MICEGNGRSVDPAAQYMLKKAHEANIETAWDRFDAMKDQCSFGLLGLCCRICMMGPCRIDPFGEGPSKGICGISPDAMVARNLIRMIAVGASAHSDHAHHILEVFHRIIDGNEKNFKIRETSKLKKMAEALGFEGDGKPPLDYAKFLAGKIEEIFHGSAEDWLVSVVPKERLDKLRSLNVIPKNIDSTIRETLHRTHMGVDADPVNLLLGGAKCSIADFLGMDLATSLSDIMLGTPAPKYSKANLGVLDCDAVNIAVHGHNPLISESIMQAVPEFQEKAKKAGAPHGLNIVGICCTGNELLMRHGIPLATNAASQELAILTGAIDAMVVDVQCIMPSTSDLCECFHTELITTMSIARIPGAKHYEFEPSTARQSAHGILELAIEAFKKRNPKRVDIPNIQHETLVGFSMEAIISVLEKINPDDPLEPLIEKIVAGDIYGIVLLCGCNNYKIPQDSSFITIAERLAADNVLMLSTGCAAGAFAKRGFLSPDATNQICGDKIKEVLCDLGKVAGIDRPLPPIWHMGSCVDNSRAHRLAFAIANRLGVDIDKLPLVASAPEAMSEKSIAIGTGAVTMGITTHIGVIPPIQGGRDITNIMTASLKDVVGANFIVETDPILAHKKIMEVLDEKRLFLGLKQSDRALYT